MDRSWFLNLICYSYRLIQIRVISKKNQANFDIFEILLYITYLATIYFKISVLEKIWLCAFLTFQTCRLRLDLSFFKFRIWLDLDPQLWFFKLQLVNALAFLWSLRLLSKPFWQCFGTGLLNGCDFFKRSDPHLKSL